MKKRKDTKERHALKLSDEKQMELMKALAERNDRLTRRAREIFRRPAFEGTELAPQGQQDAEHKPVRRLAPPIIYHGTSDCVTWARLSVPALRGRRKEE